VEKRRPLRLQSDDHHFASLLMLAVTAGALMLVAGECHEGAFGFPSRVSRPLKASWQKRLRSLFTLIGDAKPGTHSVKNRPELINGQLCRIVHPITLRILPPEFNSPRQQPIQAFVIGVAIVALECLERNRVHCAGAGDAVIAFSA
jgi:hypothetical protein